MIFNQMMRSMFNIDQAIFISLALMVFVYRFIAFNLVLEEKEEGGKEEEEEEAKKNNESLANFIVPLKKSEMTNENLSDTSEKHQFNR